MTADKSSDLTRGALLARNTLWNLVGNGAPMLVALFCIPILIRALGKERFGIVTLAWALIGYASLFDLGLGRALTQLVAQKLGLGEKEQVPFLAWTSLLLMFSLGVFGAAIVTPLSPWLIHRMLTVPTALQQESIRSFYLLGLSIPVVIVTSGLRGVLEAHQRFDLINILRIPTGIYSFASPLLVLPFSRSLVPVVSVLVVGRLIGCAAHLWLCFRVAPELSDRIAWHPAALGPLLRFGGWMTISNIVSPIMVTLDRFLIGSLISVAAVAYYATSYELAMKFLFITGAVMSVMFPAFSASSLRDSNRMALLFGRSTKLLALVLFPTILAAIVLAQNGLTLWLGSDFAQHSFRVLQWLTLGIFMNSLAQVPFSLVQGLGRPDVTAKLHLLELPIYISGLYWLTKTRGIEGTAIAWTVRVGIDALIMFALAKKFLPARASLRPYSALAAIPVLLVVLESPLPHAALLKIIFLVLVIAGFIPFVWFVMFSSEERSLTRNFILQTLDRHIGKGLPGAVQELGR